MLREDTNDKLEAMIDFLSVAEVLGRIGAICEQKAEHIRANWGDKPLAADYDFAAAHIEEILEELSV